MKKLDRSPAIPLTDTPLNADMTEGDPVLEVLRRWHDDVGHPGPFALCHERPCWDALDASCLGPGLGGR